MIVAGMGFRRLATEESLADAFDRAAAGHRVSALATAGDKVDAPAMRAFASRIGLEVVAIDDARLAVQRTVTRSPAAAAARGTGSVAEAAALAASGPLARLLVSRVVSSDRMATCALAEGEDA